MNRLRGILLSAALMAAAVPAALSAPAPDAPPKNAVFALTYVDVATASIPQAIGVLQQYHDAEAAGGNPNVELYEELDCADHFIVFEQWPDKAAYDAAKRAAPAIDLAAALKPLLSAPTDAHVYDGYAIAADHPAGPGGRARIYGFSQFRIPAGAQAKLAALAKGFADMSRADAGVMRFNILEEAAPHADQFVIVESWSTPENGEKHRTSAHALSFRDGIAPLIAGPFEDRMYGKFN